jgi:class 3 adenylate cyclase
MHKKELESLNDIIERQKAYLPKGIAANLKDPERRKLIIFFSDIVDYTKITEETDADVLDPILNKYLEDMLRIVNKHGGTLDKIIGDALMVYYYDTEPEENAKNSAIKCINMALEMQQHLQKSRKEWRNPDVKKHFNIRCGISYGTCTIRSFGTKDTKIYTCIGSHVNLASRLEKHCKTDKVLISESLKDLLAEDGNKYYSFEELPLTVKGIREEITAYHVSGIGREGKIR